MKLVWKCDHCSKTGTEEEVGRHELKCSFDPAHRNCCTCDNHDYFYDSELCIAKNPNFYDVLDKDLACKDWTNSKERTKKLKKLKNAIEQSKVL